METAICYIALVFMINLCLVYSQFLESPCPDIFVYHSADGSNVFGKIVLRRSQGAAPVSRLDLQASFSVDGYVNDYGRLDLANEKHALQGYNQGYPLQYQVQFPEGAPLPRITAITVNGNTICSGPKNSPFIEEGYYHANTLESGTVVINVDKSVTPQSNQIVTNFMLKRTTYIKSTGQESSPSIYHQQVNIESNFENDQNVQKPSQQGDENIYDNIFNYFNNQGAHDELLSTFQRPASPARPSTQGSLSRPSLLSRPLTPTGASLFSRPTLQANPSISSQVKPSRPTRPPVTTIHEESLQNELVETSTQRVVNRQPQPQSNVECGTRSNINNKLPLIYDGKSYDRGDFPWLVALYWTKGGNLNFICGGTLVSNRHVVTAAHCMSLPRYQISLNELVVKVGVHNLNDWDDDITVTRTLIGAATPDSFNRSSLQSDILVLTFNKRVEFNDYIRPACLWTGDTLLERVVGASGIVAGWGSQKKLGGAGFGEPKLAYLPIVSTTTCRSSSVGFHDITYNTTFCAGDRNGSGPCNGDSGGGLYLLDGGKWKIRGVVSVSLKSTDGLCNLDEYVVFTDTAQFQPWIRQVLQKEYFD